MISVLDAKTTVSNSYKIERRSMKNVSPEHWNDTLSKFNFCSQKATEHMFVWENKMVKNKVINI